MQRDRQGCMRASLRALACHNCHLHRQCLVRTSQGASTLLFTLEGKTPPQHGLQTRLISDCLYVCLQCAVTVCNVAAVASSVLTVT